LLVEFAYLGRHDGVNGDHVIVLTIHGSKSSKITCQKLAAVVAWLEERLSP
jgi:hypothetical protein